MTKSGMFDTPKEGEFTQGTVFSCAYAEDYPEVPVYGLVITARCDAVQDKAPIFSYLPLVSLQDWLLGDGGNLTMDRIQADCRNTMKNYLKQATLSESLLDTKTFDEIYESHFRNREGEKAWADRCTKLRAAIDAYASSHRHRAPGSPKEERKAHLVANEARVDAVLKELSGNRLTGFYLLRDMPRLNDVEENYVALLREIHHIPTKLARKIVDGVTKNDFEAQGLPAMRCPRFVPPDDLAVPVAKLKSPWIEHVMQNFTMLFARIGVADNDFAAVKKSLTTFGLGQQ